MKIIKLFNSCTLTEKIILGILSLVILISAFQIGNRFYLERSRPVPSTGGTFVEGVVGEFNFLNPVLAQTALDRDLTSMIFCGLTRFDPISNSVVDAIATHELSPDQRTYTFKIREGVKWHDGVPVTADDVIFTFQEMIQAENFPNPTLASDFFDVEITKVDDYTVTMTLQKKYAFFIYNTSVGLLPKHILQDTNPGDLLASEFNLSPVGCGPYVVDSVGGNAIRLSAFPDYYRGQPFIDSFIFRIFDSSESLAKSIDGVMGTKDFSDDQLKAFENDARLELHDFTLPQYVGLFFNTDREILKDKLVRLGLQLAIDKEAVIDVLPHRAKIIDTPLLEISSSDWKYQYDASKADGALYSSGWLYPETEPVEEDSSSTETIEVETVSESTDDPQFITLPSSDNFFATDQSEFFIEGAAPTGSEKVVVNGYQLSRFSPGNTSWSYKASLALKTLQAGENEYSVENQNGEFDSIKIFYSTDETERQTWLDKQTVEKPVGITIPVSTVDLEIDTEETEEKTEPPKLKLRYKDGEPLTLKLLVPETPEEFLTVAENVAEQWRERGMKVIIERLPKNEFFIRLNNRDYDVVLFGENLGYNLDAYPFWHSSESREGGSNLSNLKSSAVNAWLEQIRSSFDSEERRKRLGDLREVLSEEVPAVMLYTPTYSYAIDNQVRGFSLGRIALKRDRLSNTANWYLRESRELTESVSFWSFVKWFFGEAL